MEHFFEVGTDPLRGERQNLREKGETFEKIGGNTKHLDQDKVTCNQLGLWETYGICLKQCFC